MSAVFIEENGRTRPFNFRDAPYVGAYHPTVRKWLYAILGGLFLLVNILAVVDGGSWTKALVFFMFGLAVPFCLFKLIDLASHPTAVKLQRTAVGQALLQEGSDLRARWGRLSDDLHSTRPIMAQMIVDDAAAKDGRTDRIAALWKEQLALEDNLLDRQRRHLNGEKADSIGHLLGKELSS